MQKIRSRFDFSQVFGIDPRSMALFRVTLALVLLYDLWVRAADMSAFYVDSGVLPRSAQVEIYSGLPALFSLHLMNGSFAAQWMLFALEALAALALLVGYRTFWATLVSWMLLLSLHNRNPMVLQGGDVVLRVMLFWSLFLPLGARASLDRWLVAPNSDAPPDLPDKPWVSTATLAALLQICFIYWFAAALKTDASWRSEGSAVGFALSIDQLARPLGHALLSYPALMRGLTFATLLIEALGPCVALLPFWRLRLFMVLVFIGFHLVMGALMTLGLFTWIAPVVWLLFVPTGAWDWLSTRLNARPQTLKNARASLPRARAALIARSRRLGLSAPSPRPLSAWKRAATQSLCALFLLYVFAWNLRTLNFNLYVRYFPTKWNWIGEATRLDQMWSMFAPFPLKDDGWFVAPALLANGKQVDLIADGQPLKWSEPPNLSATFRDAVWQKYMLNLWSADNAAHRAYYATYLMRNWNNSHPADERIQTLQLVYMKQTNLPDFRKDKIQKIVLWKSNRS